MDYRLRLSEDSPMPPADADFAFTIDFKKGEGNPRRVFDAAIALIDAFEFIDDALIDSVDAKIEPVMVLEDVEAGSLKVWLKVGKYLVKAKYMIMEFCDDKKGTPKLSDLRDALQRLAQETDAPHLPDYAPVHEGKLVSALDRVRTAKKELGIGDKLTIESEGRAYEVDLSMRSTFL